MSSPPHQEVKESLILQAGCINEFKSKVLFVVSNRYPLVTPQGAYAGTAGVSGEIKVVFRSPAAIARAGETDLRRGDGR